MQRSRMERAGSRVEVEVEEAIATLFKRESSAGRLASHPEGHTSCREGDEASVSHSVDSCE